MIPVPKTFKSHLPTIILASTALFVFVAPSYGVTVEALQEPIRSLKTNIFGGWMMPVQIMGLACAGALSFFKQTLIPFGVGIGTVAGINFFDTYLGDGAAGALI